MTSPAPIDLQPRALRALAPPASPYPGVLAAGTPPLVWVDAADIEGSASWRAAGTGHVLAPRDAGSGPHGAIVAFDHCVSPLRVAVRRGVAVGHGHDRG